MDFAPSIDVMLVVDLTSHTDVSEISWLRDWGVRTCVVLCSQDRHEFRV